MDELYVLARCALLDALDALGEHRSALVLVGAQAIYLRVGEADLGITPYTTDGDLAIDPDRLARTPPLERCLLKTGFRRKSSSSIGEWITEKPMSQKPNVQIPIDLLVPASLSPGTGRRAARLPGHAEHATRKVSGLESALVDSDILQLGALDPADTRSHAIRVAGPAALLVAKMFKIHDRTSETDRVRDKDALDVFRLLRGVSTAEVAERYPRLLASDRSAESSQTALALLEELFTNRGFGLRMLARAVTPQLDPVEAQASCEVLVRRILERIGSTFSR